MSSALSLFICSSNNILACLEETNCLHELLDRNILLLKLNFHLFPCAYWLHFQSSCIFFNTYHYICAKPTSFILTNLTFDHLSYHDKKRTTQLKQANRRTLKDHPFFQNLNFYLTLFDLLWQIGSPTL